MKKRTRTTRKNTEDKERTDDERPSPEKRSDSSSAKDPASDADEKGSMEQRHLKDRTRNTEHTDAEEKRYTTRLGPPDNKPSSYLWGYKNWDPPETGNHDADRRDENPVPEKDERELSRGQNVHDGPTSTRKWIEERSDEEDPENDQ